MAKKKKRLYEISALVNYVVVVYADSKEAAMKEIQTWEKAWPANSDFAGVSDVELIDVRDGTEEEAHVSAAAK